MKYLTCHLYFFGVRARLKVRVCTEKMQVTRWIFHGTAQAGSEINFFTWPPCGDLTKIFGRQVSICGRQIFFPFFSQ